MHIDEFPLCHLFLKDGRVVNNMLESGKSTKKFLRHKKKFVPDVVIQDNILWITCTPMPGMILEPRIRNKEVY